MFGYPLKYTLLGIFFVSFYRLLCCTVYFEKYLIKCDDLGHIGILCSGISDTERLLLPPVLTVLKVYLISTDDYFNSVLLSSSPASRIEETTKQKEKAGIIL